MSVLIAIALILCLPMIPRGPRLCLMLPLAVLQIYPPWLVIGQVPIPLALILAYSFWPELLKEARSISSIKTIKLMLGIGLITIVSFLWSVNVRLGLVTLNNIVSFIIVFAGVANQARVNHRWIVNALRITYIATLALAASVAVFRLDPSAKLIYLQTNMATWFINSNLLTDLFGDGRNNVFDPEKSGGFAFVNANVASTFIGVVAMTALGTSRAYKRPLDLLIALVLCAAVPLTGSKAGLFLIFPMVMFFLLYKIAKRDRGYAAVFAVHVALIAVLIVKIGGVFDSSSAAAGLGGQVASTADTRLQLWEFAGKMFLKDPVLGQGFGGWQVAFPSYARFAGVPTDLPPHNTFIYLWSQSGLIAVVLGVAFVIQVLWLPLHLMGEADRELAGLSAALALGYLWLLVQGFGENQGLLGDVHIQPLLAAALALFTVRVTTIERRGGGAHA